MAGGAGAPSGRLTAPLRLEEQAGDRPEPPSDSRARGGLGGLRDRLERLRTQLAALPTVGIEQLDALDTRARALTKRRDVLRGELDRIPAPRERRLGRN